MSNETGKEKKDKDILERLKKRAEVMEMLKKHKMPEERHDKEKRKGFFELMPQYQDPHPDNAGDKREVERRKRPDFSAPWTTVEANLEAGLTPHGKEKTRKRE